MTKYDAETLSITPDPTLFGKLGARSGALPNVVTELVDNSLDSWTLLPASYRRNRNLDIRVNAGSVEGSWFVVTDNAGGMTRDELVSAMTIARSNKGALEKADAKGLLGFYGFGLKSAASFIGDYFRIFTKSYKEKNEVHFVEFDRTKFESADSKQQWKLEFKTMTLDQAAKQEVHFKDGHGTIIQIRNKRYRPASQYGIIDRLRRTFAPRLPCDPRLRSQNGKYAYEEIHIYFITSEAKAAAAKPLTALGAFYTVWNKNRSEVEKIYKDRYGAFKRAKSKEERKAALEKLIQTDALKGDQEDDESILPKLEWIETIPGVTEIPEVKICGKRVRGRVGILDRGMAHTGEYGFDLIKNGRIIELSAKDPEKKKEQFIGLVANNHNARIIGQLFLDEWPTDHQKKEFIKEDSGWSKSKDSDADKSIASYIYDFLKRKGFFTISQSLQSPRSAVPGADDHIDDEEKIVIDKITETVADAEKSLARSLRSEAVKEQLKKLDKLPQRRDMKPRGDDESPKQTSSSKLQMTKPEIAYEKVGEGKALCSVRVIEEKGVRRLKVVVNIDHPFLKKRESGETKALGDLIAVDAFASHMGKEKLIFGDEHEAFLSLRDELLRGLR